MRSSGLFPSRRLARWHLILPLTALLALLTATPATERLDLWLYDTLIQQSRLPPPDDLTLVVIDEKSLDRLGRWPWPRQYHATLIDRLDQAGARTIAFDILFTEPSERGAQDRQLAEAMERHGNVVLPLHIYPGDDEQRLREFLPIARLTKAASALGHVHVELDDDGIVRGFYRREGLGEAVWPSLADAAIQQSGMATQGASTAKVTADAPFVNVRQNRVRIPFSGRAGRMPSVSYIDVLEGRVPPQKLRDKVVFVGITAAGFGDVLPTPVSGRTAPLSGVEFHANAFSAIAQDRVIQPIPDWVSLALGLFSVIIIGACFPRWRPLRTLGLAAALTLLPVLVSYGLLRFQALWLAPGAPALTATLAFPLWTAQRLSLLNRFLNRQLHALGRERRITIGRLEDRPPAQLLDELQELLQASDSWLTTNGQPVRGQPPSGSDTHLPQQQPGKWHHEASRSRIHFFRNGYWHELGLVWASEADAATVSPFLDSLHLHAGTTEPVIERSRERVSHHIEQVHNATLALAGMRRFIGSGFERMPDGVIVTDALGVIRYVNARIPEWFQLPRESLTGMPLQRLMISGSTEDSRHPQRIWRERILTILNERHEDVVDYWLWDRALLVHLAPFDLPEQRHPGLIVNLSDITNLRERQRQYREAIDFISHDVRSPLVSQLALLDQLRRDNQSVAPETLNQIDRLARRSYQLAEEFVQLARAEELTDKRFYDCELLTIAENAVDAVQEQALANQVRLELDGREDLWLSGNAELLERAVINLLTNAIQYSPSNTVVAVSVENAGQTGALSVTDQGPGIELEDQPMIFQRFRRQKGTEMGGPHGAGLGLAFVQTVAERHRGVVDLVSTPGRGSTFRLYLPLTESD